MKKLASFLLFLFAFAILPAYAQETPTPPANITFLNPGAPDDPFYQQLTTVMKVAAKDLELNLEIVNAKGNRLAIARLGKEILKRAQKPDYLMLINYKGTAAPLIKEANKKGIKTFLFHEGLSDLDRARFGAPRKKIKNWVGNIQPNDRQSGASQAEELIKQALLKGLIDPQGLVHLIAINGDQGPVARERLMGLNDTLSRYPNVKLHNVTYANWDGAKAFSETRRLLKRFPETGAIWTASDAMGNGALEAAKQKGRAPGKDIVIGTVGWSPKIIKAARTGEITAALGGHFLDGAWALVLLTDHYHGFDFPASFKTKYAILQKNNEQLFAKFIKSPKDWNKIDFAKFSRHYVSEIEFYDFTLKGLLDKLPQ